MVEPFTIRKSPLFIMVFVGFHVLIFANIWNLSKDLLYGDGSVKQVIPSPRYAPLRIPDTDFARSFQGQNRLAADFAQIYFPTQDESNSAYTTDTVDPWDRPSRYAPILHEICRATICKLAYGPASVLHVYLQIALFVASMLYAFVLLDIRKQILLGILLVDTCLFLTPVGLSVFERGQFSLYVASSYIWLFLGLVRPRYTYFVLSASFAYIKFTSLPFVFVVFCLWLLTSEDPRTFFQRLKLCVSFVMVAGLMFAVQPEDGIRFVRGLIEQEAAAEPAGFSLSRFLPPHVLKILPLLMIGFGYFLLRLQGQLLFFHLLPYLLGVSILLLMYPTLAFDYSVPTLLGVVPVTIWWHTHTANDYNVPTRYVLYGFLLFILIASYPTVAGDYPLPLVYSYIVYFCFAAMFIILPYRRSVS